MATNELTLGREHVLAPICKAWLRKIKDAKKAKWDRFGQYAVEGMKFYDGVHDWMWKDEYSKGQQGFLEKGSGAALPTFRMQVNRIFEAVAIFGPALYHRNPTIEVTPVHPPFIDPGFLGIQPRDENDTQMTQLYEQVVQQQQHRDAICDLKSQLGEHYLNWVQVESNKKMHARRSITEAIIKGMGLLWTGVHQPRGSTIKYPTSYHVSVDDLVVDPDAEYWEDVQWIARYRCLPVNLVEREFGLPRGTLKGHMESMGAQGETYSSKKDTHRKRRSGRSFDLIEYWEVYSKNGFGDLLRTTTDQVMPRDVSFEPWGDFCKIVVADNVPFPLNVPTYALKMEDEESLFQRVQWEVPYWVGGTWPFARLAFYDKPRCVWPISIIKPVVGELRFVNWCMSFLADKTAAACTTYVAQAKQAGVEIQNQLKNGMAPYTVLEISQMTGKSIADVISFLDAPNFSVDIWRMLAEVLDMVDKRTGLTDLVYGMTNRQLRSATEAEVKEQNTNIRPDDMASSVEDFLSETALNEYAACVWACDRQDVLPVLGDLGATIFEQQIKTDDFERIVRDYKYRVAAGTARKPNKASKSRALAELGQVILPTLQQFVMQGVTEPWNTYVSDVADAMDIDPSGYLIEAEEQEGPDPQEQMQQMEMQMKQLELQIKQQEAAMKIEQKQAEADVKLDTIEQQQELSEEEAEAKLEQERELHRQEMRQRKQEAAQDMLIKKAELAMMTEENRIKLEGLKMLNRAKAQAIKTQQRAREQESQNAESPTD